MPRRSKVLLLPRPVRSELESEMVRRGFAGYSELTAWLRREGHAVSESTLQRHGARLGRRIEQVRIATEQAQALIAGSPDDEGAVSEAALRIVQQRMFDLLLAAEEGDLKSVSAAARAMAEATKAASAVRAERRRIAEAAAEAAQRVAGAEAARAGAVLPPAALTAIREQVYGIVEAA